MQRLSWVILAGLVTAGCSGGDKDTTETGVPADTDTDTDSDSDTDTDTDADTDSDTDTDTEWPATPDDYLFGDATVLYEIVLPEDPTACCKDWGSISKDNVEFGSNNNDNALAAIGLAADAFGLSLQDTIDAVLQTGAFVPLLEHRNLPVADGSYDMIFFTGQWENTITWTDVSNGDGVFKALPSNFVNGTGEPVAVFGNATIQGNDLDARQGNFEINMPLTAGANLILPLQDVEILTSVNRTANGVDFIDGTLTGYVTVEDFYAAYNAVVASECGCLGVSGDLYTEQADGSWLGACVANPETVCTQQSEDFCWALGGTDLFGGELCTVVPTLIGAAADLDLDQDPQDPAPYDALSAGLEIQGTSALINGVAP